MSISVGVWMCVCVGVCGCVCVNNSHTGIPITSSDNFVPTNQHIFFGKSGGDQYIRGPPVATPLPMTYLT